MKTISVETGRPYDVFIGRGILSRCGKIAAQLPHKSYAKAAIVTDSNVDPLYARVVEDSFAAAGMKVIKFVFAAGENSKQMDNLRAILEFLADKQVTRTDLLVALGGGVVGDITGFAASIYLRGLDYLQIPTTLLAATDSSVGGKTAVNIPQGKNLVGSFWQPVAVVCDVDTLSTLSPEVFADGSAEVLKYGCIWDRQLFADIAGGGLRHGLEDIVARSVEIKAQVVQQDERDTGLRQILNFGHTIGHGIEKLSGFGISHGRAVAMGMYWMARVGEAHGITKAGTAERLLPALQTCGLSHRHEYPLDALCAACLGDKKRAGNSISLILLEEIGKCRIHPVQVQDFPAFVQRGAGE